VSSLLAGYFLQTVFNHKYREEKTDGKNKIIKAYGIAQKKTFDYTFKMMISLQDQIEKMVIPWFEQYQIPIEEKEDIHDWLHNSKKNRDEYQQMIEDGFKTLELYF